MKNIFLLVKAMLKGNGIADLGGDRTGRKKKGKGRSLGAVIMLTFAGLYLGGIGVVYIFGGFELLKPLGLESIIIGIAVSAIAFLVFFFGLFYAMSIFYFSSDVEKLLPLPVTPGQLIAAKFLVTLVYEYLVTLVLLAPAMITYGILEKAGVLYYIYMVVALILLPVVPLVMSCILIMLIMRFAPAARNKDRFTLVASGLAIVAGLGLSFSMQSLFMNSDSKNYASILTESAKGISKISSGIFPGTYFANYALAKPEGWDSFLMMMIFIAIAAIGLLLLYVAGNLLYFKGVIGVTSSSSRGKALSAAEFEESTMPANVFITYMRKDIRVLFRTPVFLMNNVLMNFIMPFLLIVPLFLNSQDDGFSISSIKKMAGESVFGGDMQFAPFLILGFYGLISFICGTNGITESAISREGSCAYFMKIIPMSYRMQIWAKVSVGVLFSTISAILSLILLCVVLLPPLWFVLVCIATIPGAILFPNVTGIIFDLYMPKIKWDNEQKAVKQNMNVLYGMLTASAMVAVVAIIVVKFSLTLVPAVAVVILVPLVFTLASAAFINQNSARILRQLTP